MTKTNKTKEGKMKTTNYKVKCNCGKAITTKGKTFDMFLERTTCSKCGQWDAVVWRNFNETLEAVITGKGCRVIDGKPAAIWSEVYC